MATSSRRTYDTDSVVLRRIFVKNPETNQQFSTNALLATSTNGSAVFVDAVTFFNSLGFPTSDTFPSTVAGLGTAGYISTAGGGSGDVTKANLVSTVAGLGTAGYLSTAGSGDVTRANLASTVAGLGTVNYISLATLNSTLASTVAGLGTGTGDVTRLNLASTVAGLGTVNYISTASLTSTIQGLGSLGYISLATLNSTLASTVAGLGTGSGDVTKANLISSIEGLATSGYISSSQMFSAIRGISILNAFSTVSSLIISAPTAQVNILMAGATIGTYILNSISVGVANSDVTSTTRGLGTLNYISLATLNSTLASTVAGINLGTGITVANQQSSLTGLGTLNYISLATLNSTLASTVAGIGPGGGITQSDLVSSLQGLGTLSYISVPTLNSTLASTTRGLGTMGYVSSSTLFSTVTGLGRIYASTGFLQSNLSSFSTSLTRNFLVSTVTASTVIATEITANLLTISTISFGAGSGFLAFTNLRAQLISSFSTVTNVALVNNFISGPQARFSSFQGNGSLLTNLSVGFDSALRSTGIGLGTLNYISLATLNSTLASTVAGIGTGGGGGATNTTYLSSIGISTSFLSTGQGFALNGQTLFMSTNTSTLKQNLFVNELPVGSYNPVRVIYSTLGACNDVYLKPEDIGKYFLFEAASSGAGINLPSLPDPFLDGWNIVIKNMATSAYNLDVQTTTTTTLSPGLATTVVMDGINSYSL